MKILVFFGGVIKILVRKVRKYDRKKDKRKFNLRVNGDGRKKETVFFTKIIISLKIMKHINHIPISFSYLIIIICNKLSIFNLCSEMAHAQGK